VVATLVECHAIPPLTKQALFFNRFPGKLQFPNRRFFRSPKKNSRDSARQQRFFDRQFCHCLFCNSFRRPKTPHVLFVDHLFLKLHPMSYRIATLVLLCQHVLVTDAA
jgi:hypothetical protein